jgi:hypothetical protein
MPVPPPQPIEEWKRKLLAAQEARRDHLAAGNQLEADLLEAAINQILDSQNESESHP